MMDKHNKTERTRDYAELLAEETLVIAVLEDFLGVLEERGISQAELARRLGVSRSAVNRILNGRNLTVRTVARLAHALGTKVEVRFPPRHSESLAGAYRAAEGTQSWLHRGPANNIYILPAMGRAAA